MRMPGPSWIENRLISKTVPVPKSVNAPYMQHLSRGSGQPERGFLVHRRPSTDSSLCLRIFPHEGDGRGHPSAQAVTAKKLRHAKRRPRETQEALAHLG